MICWGADLFATNVHFWAKVEEARKRGVKLVVIDPRRTRSAQVADWHIPIRIGTDAALALGIMHILVRDDLCDRDYIAQHTLGFDRVEREVLPRFTPDHVAAITGIAAADVERLAAMYGAREEVVHPAGLGHDALHLWRPGAAHRRAAARRHRRLWPLRRRRAAGTAASFELNYNAVRKPSGPAADAHDQSQPAGRGAAGAERSADPRAVHRREQSGDHLP